MNLVDCAQLNYWDIVLTCLLFVGVWEIAKYGGREYKRIMFEKKAKWPGPKTPPSS